MSSSCVCGCEIGFSSTRRGKTKCGITLKKAGELRVYVISGTVAQWYFTKEDSTPKRVIRSSLRFVNLFAPTGGRVSA
ncbi:hypothetical protein RchiOBHm_Chr7g0187121 [Rosa chinensis]|uniref:Uncharacterized protein n=1 Tax=Rosa chinensis TaxID=74649 RepID=A0A2P6P474_ROSCH|nr:hypothetical protein RchiOBHm_Chr7g0187121 [Rosa chinensis]